MKEKLPSFVRKFGPVAVFGLALALGGCMQTWERVAQTIMPKNEPVAVTQPAPAPKPEIRQVEIAALPDLTDMEMASGSPADRHPAFLHIEQLGDEVLSILENGAIDADGRIEIFRDLLARDLDIPLIARFVMGRYWKKATPAQRDAYKEVFSQFLVQTYSTRLGGVQIDDFEVNESRAIGKKDFLVRSHVDNGTRKPVRADWRVRMRDGGFKIIDLSVQGISMALMLRQEFASVLRKNGIDGLIVLLQDRTA